MHSHTPHARAVVLGTLFLIAAFGIAFIAMHYVGKLSVFEDENSLQHINVGGVAVTAYIADTPQKRIQGLSGIGELPKNHGMLFVFDRDDFYSIWMKDMQFSIDVLWLTESGTVIDIAESLSPSTYPETFAPKEPARYILELPNGFVHAHGINIGSIVSI